jgi:hypothetical protein
MQRLFRIYPPLSESRIRRITQITRIFLSDKRHSKPPIDLA